ncbi:Mutator-like element transposase [Fusarium beomiforme]|uniref:Mutator-like element transposase n=1 Tax=Fusarium beomiforme TaxID=44412 RepID=A0A9P5DRC8_9HYPO|nr:Mutator-like element transposase [Fusarium beomiforme]
MPLLDIVGVDALKRTFCIAFAFLSGEDEDDFGWALSRLRGIYDLNGITPPGVILTDRCLACINALGFSDCFPRSYVMLCNWHITNAVTVNCKPSFFSDSGDPENGERWKEFLDFWSDIVRSPTQDIYYERLRKFKVKYVPTHLNEVGYCIENWLTLYKERFLPQELRAFTDLSNHI